MDLVFGGLVHLLCLCMGTSLQVRWQRLNKKDVNWQSTDIVRFLMYLTGVAYLYATIGTTLLRPYGAMLSTAEWYLLCSVHGFTSGPLYAYGRSVLAEASMVGYEGLYVGLMTASSLILSLVAPIVMETATVNGWDLNWFFLWP